MAEENTEEIKIKAILLLEFDDYTAWVNHAQTWYKICGVDSCNTLAVDSRGRVCVSGANFKRARDENTFPVRVYKVADYDSL